MTKCALVFSDPWDSLDKHGSITHSGKIVRRGEGGVLVKLNETLQLEAGSRQYVVCKFRHETTSLSEKPIPVNIIAITEEQAHSDQPLDVSWWRGGDDTIMGSITIDSDSLM